MLYRFKMVNGYETTHNIKDLDIKLAFAKRFLVLDENGFVTRINLDNVTVIEQLESGDDE